HGARHTVEPDRLPDQRRVRAERLNPQLSADHDYGRGAGLIVAGAEAASDLRTGAEQLEEVRGDERLPRLERFSAGRADGCAAGADRGKPLEHLRVPAEPHDLRTREPGFGNADPVESIPDHQELRRIAIGERLEE